MSVTYRKFRSLNVENFKKEIGSVIAKMIRGPNKGFKRYFLHKLY